MKRFALVLAAMLAFAGAANAVEWQDEEDPFEPAVAERAALAEYRRIRLPEGIEDLKNARERAARDGITIIERLRLEHGSQNLKTEAAKFRSCEMYEFAVGTQQFRVSTNGMFWCAGQTLAVRRKYQSRGPRGVEAEARELGLTVDEYRFLHFAEGPPPSERVKRISCKEYEWEVLVPSHRMEELESALVGEWCRAQPRDIRIKYGSFI